ncbi:MAG: putative toxin-antitoxin system toxin component, PIN family [Deltaproteobacteria bacterium]|nr:putative toxin-antitoxin system toxin component, PIN family [Deltaproteobacteria bacterium]
MNVVIDTNVLISAILQTGSPPARILDLALSGDIRLISSFHLLQEIDRVVQYPRITKAIEKRLPPDKLPSFLNKIREIVILTPGELVVDDITEDSPDNLVLACAVEGKADFIISGDHHLIDLKSFRGIRIVAPATFLRFFARK